MTQDQEARAAILAAVTGGVAPVASTDAPNSVEARLTALHDNDVAVEMRVDGLEAGARGRLIDINDLNHRLSLVEAQPAPAEYHFGRDLLQRVSSRKLWGAIAGVAITIGMLVDGQITGGQALAAITAIIGGYGLVEGGADIAGRITGR